MDKFEKTIAEALSAEDQALLRSIEEPSYFEQAFGLFRGRLGWVVGVAYVSGLLAFAGFVYALWQLWTGTDVLQVLRWGIVAVLLFQFTAIMKSFLGSHLEANRMLRELKRVELQLSLMRERPGA